MASLRRGRIVWAELADPQGRNPKIRPAVVLSTNDQITDDGTVDVAAISTELSAALPAHMVELPWHRDGHPKTKLKRRCAVICDWQVTVAVADIREPAGFVPDDRLKQILDIIDSLKDGTSG